MTLRRKLIQGALLVGLSFGLGASVFSQAEAVSPNATHSQIIPIRHSISSNALIFVSSGTYRPGAGVTTIRVTAKGGGGAGGGKGGIAGGAGGASSLAALLSVSGGLGGAAGSGGAGGNGADGNEFSGWETNFPLSSRAAQGNACFYSPCEPLPGQAGVMPGAGGGGVAGGLGGRTGQYVFRQTLVVVPGVAYAVTVGAGGVSPNGAAGKGADGFVLIEW